MIWKDELIGGKRLVKEVLEEPVNTGAKVYHVVTFGSDQIRTYRGKSKKTNPADSYRLSTPECVPGRTRTRTEET